jgi:uncharacterized heparinase superfamily protein
VSPAARWLRTVAHLSADQVWHRLRLTLRRRLWERLGARVDARYRRRAAALRPAAFGHPGLRAVAVLHESLRPAEAAHASARAALEGRFRLLGQERDLGRDVAWHRPDLHQGTRLWKTLLHEFSFAEDLARAWRDTRDAAYRARLFELARSWRAASPIGCPGFALDAWNARAVVNRLVHWSVAGTLLEPDAEDADAAWLGREIGLHGLFLRDNLELDLRGNHLLRDAVGALFAQTLCGGVPDALDLLEAQVREQVLADGCHIERSPMYHAIAVRDLLEARLLLGEAAPDWLDDALRRSAGFLDALLLGDGDLPLLGDTWLGETAPGELLAAVRRFVGAPIAADPGSASGLLPLRCGDARAVLRAGPHGPDYQLGHAHADLLSFDLSLGAARVVTDTGTSLYDAGPERQHLRSTAAHNTLQVDGQEQIEAWGSFRTGRRGRAWLRARGSADGWTWAWAAHDAWRHLPGGPVHERLLALHERGALVLDALLGGGSHALASRLHLHPERPDSVHAASLGQAAAEGRAPLHERWGATRPMTQLRVEARARLPWFGGWWIGDGEPPQPLSLRTEGGAVEVRAGEACVVRWTPDAPAAGAAVRLGPAPRS